MERYERIKAISGGLMQENCPVIFEKGALLKDNKSGKNILQLQFESICNDLIEAVYFSVNCFDVENRLVETSEKVYLDLTLKYGGVFGSNQAIELNSDLSRNYKFTINKIIFAGNRITEYSGKMGAIEQPEKLAELVELKEQYIREVSKIHRTLTCKVKPTDYNGFWWCTCGALNHGENCKCGICGIDKEKLFSLLNTDFLIEQHSEFLKQKEIEELQKKQQEEKRLEEIKKQEEIRQIKRKKNKKIALVVVGIVFALCIIYGLVVTFGVPAMKYSSALKAINNSNYEEGYQILEELGDYRDSKEQILAGKYKEALEYIENKEYENGYKLLNELGDYSDATEQILIAKYSEAGELFEEQKYSNAVNIYEELGDYSDAAEKLVEARYQFAKELIDGKAYLVALEQLNSIKTYKDANELYRVCAYEYASECFGLNNYEEAVAYYGRAGSYKDAQEMHNESKYQYIKNNLSAEDKKSVLYLEQLKQINYKNFKELEKQLYKLKVEVFVSGDSMGASYDASRLSKYENWYFHIYIVNGEPDKAYTLKYTMIFPDGGILKSTSEPFKWHDIIYGYYSENAAYGKAGTATLKVYDSAGNFLAEKSVQIY